MQCTGRQILISGKLAEIARLPEELFEDVDSPDRFVRELRKSENKPDILTSWQRLSETELKFDDHMRLQNVAALPTNTCGYW